MKPILFLFSMALLPCFLTGCVSAGAGIGPDGAGAGVSVGLDTNTPAHQSQVSQSVNDSQDKQNYVAKL